MHGRVLLPFSASISFHYKSLVLFDEAVPRSPRRFRTLTVPIHYVTIYRIQNAGFSSWSCLTNTRIRSKAPRVFFPVPRTSFRKWPISEISVPIRNILSVVSRRFGLFNSISALCYKDLLKGFRLRVPVSNIERSWAHACSADPGPIKNIWIASFRLAHSIRRSACANAGSRPKFFEFDWISRIAWTWAALASAGSCLEVLDFFYSNWSWNAIIDPVRLVCCLRNSAFVV